MKITRKTFFVATLKLNAKGHSMLQKKFLNLEMLVVTRFLIKINEM